MTFRMLCFLIVTLFLLPILNSCSQGTNPQVMEESKGDSVSRNVDFNSPEEQELTAQVILTGNFQEQIEYFINYYGRIPESYEEWRDSGFLLFTLWPGSSTRPAAHVDYSPSADSDSLGTFHYETVNNTTYKLELVQEIRDKLEVFSMARDISEPRSSVRKGILSYTEAKADQFFALLGLLEAYYYYCPALVPEPRQEPADLLEIAQGYLSLVPEGFRVPEGEDVSGFFEFGFDLKSNKAYAFTDLTNSRFRKMIDGFGDPVEAQKQKLQDHKLLPFFSSELLKEGFPGLFD